MKHNKTAFSFVELILVLIILFVILASFMPMITRRHLNPPTKANHGTYACYRGIDGGLRQTLIKGTKTIENDIPVTECTFDPPKKARYFYVQIIGGGGAGQQISASGVTPESNSSYRIKGQNNTKQGYLASGCRELFEAGTTGVSGVSASGGCSSYSSQQLNSYPINSFKNFEEFKELVKDYKLAVHANGFKGRECTQWDGNSSTTQFQISGAYCEDGETYNDSTVSCEAKIYDDGSLYPDNILTKTESPDHKYYQLPCTNKDENHVCLMCSDYDRPINHCDPPNGVTEGCFESKVYMAIDDCFNHRVGGPGYFYAHVPLEKLYKTVITSSAYKNSPSKILYNGEYVAKAYNGVGQSFTWKEHDKSNNSSVIIKGGTGAVIGMPQNMNPYYPKGSAERKCKFCSPPHGDVTTPNTYAAIQPDYNGEEDDTNTLRNAHCLSSEADIQCKQGIFGAPDPHVDDVNVFDYTKLKIADINLTQKQVIPYGIGGKSGQIKTLIFKEISEGLKMNPGRGGIIGHTHPGYTVGSGEDTTIEGAGIPLKKALGGAAGNQTFTANVPIHPFGEGDASKIFQWVDPGHWRTYTTANITARKGGNVSYNSYLKFIISYRNENIINIMKNFGAGGHGTASKTECTLGYQYNPLALINNGKFINHILPGDRVNVAPQQLFDVSRGMKCNGKYEWTQTYNNTYYNNSSYYHPEYNPDPTIGIPEGYWKGAVTIDEDATNGGSGAVVISW